MSSVRASEEARINVWYCSSDGVDANTPGTLPTDIVGGNPMAPGCLIPRPIERPGSTSGTDITTDIIQFFCSNQGNNL